MSVNKTPYGLAPIFEKVVVALCCTSEAFWNRIGKAIDPDKVITKEAKLLLQACHAIAKDGHTPQWEVIQQRLDTWCKKGDVKRNDINAANLWVEKELDGNHSEDAVSNELKAILSRDMEKEALDVGFSSFQERQSLDKLIPLIEKISRLGQIDALKENGYKFTELTWERINLLNDREYLKTSIPEIDDLTGTQGFIRKTLTSFMANTGGGKSHALVQTACSAAIQGFNTAYITLELSTEDIFTRMLANISNQPINSIKTDKDKFKQGMDLLNAGVGTGDMGIIVTARYGSDAVTVREIKNYIAKQEEIIGDIDVVIIDYADKIYAPTRGNDSSGFGTYNALGKVYEELASWAQSRKKWVFTASQVNKKIKDKDDEGYLDVYSMAESRKKAFVADYVFSINRVKDNRIVIYSAKNRHSDSEIDTGAIPHDYANGRLALTKYPDWWEALVRKYIVKK